MWYAVRFLGLFTLLIFIIFLLYNVIIAHIRTVEDRKRDALLHKAIVKAIEDNAFNVDIVKKENKEK